MRKPLITTLTPFKSYPPQQSQLEMTLLHYCLNYCPTEADSLPDQADQLEMTWSLQWVKVSQLLDLAAEPSHGHLAEGDLVPFALLVIGLRSTADGSHLVHKGVVAIGNADVGDVCPTDVIPPNAFMHVVRPQPVLLHLSKHAFF